METSVDANDLIVSTLDLWAGVVERKCKDFYIAVVYSSACFTIIDDRKMHL